MASYIRRRKFLALLGGAAVAWPLTARAQQADRMRRIGVLAGYERPLPEHEAFRKQLQELGYVEGKNLVIDWRYPEQGTARLPILAEELVALRPDVLVSITTPATAAVKAAAGGIPVVFSIVGDPVAAGASISNRRPHQRISMTIGMIQLAHCAQLGGTAGGALEGRKKRGRNIKQEKMLCRDRIWQEDRLPTGEDLRS